MSDPVNHPPHYTGHPSGVECIEITRHLPFSLGNAVKYVWRAGEKDDLRTDLEKARWYLRDYAQTPTPISARFWPVEKLIRVVNSELDLDRRTVFCLIALGIHSGSGDAWEAADSSIGQWLFAST